MGRGTPFLLLLLPLFALLVPMGPPAWAQDLDPRRGEPVEITADRIVYEARRQVYVAQGEVRVVQAERSIDADWLVFNRVTRRGIAAGNVRVDDGDTVLEARFLEFDHLAERGLVLTGRLDLGEDDFRMAAGELIKTGDKTYRAVDASFTTCRCPEDDDRLPWQLNAGKADVELGGYAMVTNTTIDVLGVPTVWVPWMMVPIKTERATGILPPELGIGGSNGWEVAVPFFWAARDNVNVIATPRYMTERGFKPELTVEAVYGRESEMELYGSYIRDQDAETFTDDVFDDMGVLTGTKERTVASKNRWAVGFDNDVHLPEGVRIRSDIQVVSDNDYVRDFSDFRDLRKDRFLESRVFGFGHFGAAGSGGLVVGGVYVDDRQNPDFDDRDKFVMQRAPDATLAWMPTPIPGAAGLSFEMGADYAHFRPYERAEIALDLDESQIVGDDLFADIGIAAIVGVPSDPDDRMRFGVGDGRFQEGEPLNDYGHRVVLHPRVALPFRVADVVQVHPQVGWQQTLYTTRAQSFEQRGLVTARADVTTQVIGDLDLPGLPPILHRVEPRVGWAFVSDVSQRGNPLFVPPTRVPQDRIRQLSLGNVVGDSADRIESTNLLTVGAGNRFFVRGPKGPELRAEFDLSAGYDFEGSGVGDLAQLIVDGTVFAGAGIETDFNISYDLEKGRVAQGLFEFTIPVPKAVPVKRGSYLRAGYRYRRDIPLFYENFDQGETFNRFRESFDSIQQITGRTRLRLTESWAVEYQFGYSLEESLMLANRAKLEYTSGCRCWAIQVTAEEDRSRGFQAAINFTILGFGQDITNPFKGGGLAGSSVY